MNERCMTRPVDALGRVVLPIGLRRKMDIKHNDLFEILTEDDTILLEKYSEKCIFCSGTDNVTLFKDKPICMNCINDMLDSDSNKAKD